MLETEKIIDDNRWKFVGALIDILAVNDPSMRARMICALPYRLSCLLHQVIAQAKGTTNEIAADRLQREGEMPDLRQGNGLPSSRNRSVERVDVLPVRREGGPQKEAERKS